MNKSGKFCVVCGRSIPELSSRKTVCSEACRVRYKRGDTPFKDCEGPIFDALTEAQQEAAKMGMSYGKYMAMKYNERGE